MPLHIAQQQQEKDSTTENSETSPKSQSSAISDCISSSVQETDSGRHSLSDSPPAPFYSGPAGTKQTSAGTFISKCTSSSGTAVTMSQTMQKLQQKNNLNEFVIKKKWRSTSRDQVREQMREQTMTKSNSFTKSSLPPPAAANASGTGPTMSRSHSSDRRTFSSNGNINAFNTKRSSSSINRNCSDL